MILLAALAEERTDGVLHYVAELADLNEAGADGEIDAGADQQQKHDGTPGEAVDRAVDICYDFEKFIHLFYPFLRLALKI